MADSKVNYKFDLSVRGLVGMATKTSVNYNNNYLNLTHFECRIQNLINLQGNRKKLKVFFLLLSFQIPKINPTTTSVRFF